MAFHIRLVGSILPNPLSQLDPKLAVKLASRSAALMLVIE